MRVNGKKFVAGMKALISQDCRVRAPDFKGVDRSGETGLYMGRCWVHNKKPYRGPRRHLFQVSPMFALPGGDYIFGIECWWSPL